MPQFNRYIGIDYSGAETADSSCKGFWVPFPSSRQARGAASCKAVPPPRTLHRSV
jgi:hypothetical protein